MNPHTTTSPPPTSSPWLSRVQALLAKAESTDFPDEAESLLTKAQDLMARHAISEAMLSAERLRSGGAPDPVGSRRIVVEAPYATAKRTLLGAVASANGCRCVYLPQTAAGRPCQIFGHESDLAKVETLFASLSVQAARAMVGTPVPRGDTPRRFRHAFLLAYANRVGQRMVEAGAAARAAAAAEAEATDAGALAVVLRSREAAVDRALADAYPRTRKARATATSGAGWRSGRSAAEGVGLGQRGLADSRPALGRGR
jgi:hypothetical protein